GYVNAHGTATESGDIAESLATHRVFGDRAPISSLKSYLGHTLGAAGALEAWITILMMREDWFAPTLNLEDPDPRCAPLDYVRGEQRALRVEHVMSNNFAFGGVNTSLIFTRWSYRRSATPPSRVGVACRRWPAAPVGSADFPRTAGSAPFSSGCSTPSGGPMPPTVPCSPPTCTTTGSTARPTLAACRNGPAAGRRTARPCLGPAGPRPGTSCRPRAPHRGSRR